MIESIAAWILVGFTCAAAYYWIESNPKYRRRAALAKTLRQGIEALFARVANRTDYSPWQGYVDHVFDEASEDEDEHRLVLEAMHWALRIHIQSPLRPHTVRWGCLPEFDTVPEGLRLYIRFSIVPDDEEQHEYKTRETE